MIFLKNILDSIDVCFLQEHWLIPEQFNQIDAINDDFLSVNVCGMDNFSLLAGRPFGGCSILYRKTLSLTVSPLSLSSNRVLFESTPTVENPISFLMFTCRMRAMFRRFLTILTPLVRFKE